MRRIKRLHAYPVIFLAFIIQILLSNLLGVAAIKPNLMIIITAFFALFTDRNFGFEVGLLSGMLLDIVSIRFFGINTILFAFGGYLIGRYNTKFYKDSIITHIIITFATSFFILSAYLFFVSLRNPAGSSLLDLSIIFNSSILISSLINSFLAIWIYAFFTNVFRLSESSL